jgi:hypothetical protein
MLMRCFKEWEIWDDMTIFGKLLIDFLGIILEIRDLIGREEFFIW